MPTSADISVVVQGPVRRRTDANGFATAEALASIRASLPDAEIILSTWEAEDVTGLEPDILVQSPDPGPLVQAWFTVNNVNRMVRSTAAGLAAATRPLAVKTRTDTVLASDSILHLPLSPAADPALGLVARIQVTSIGFKNPLTTGYQYHPADLVQFGTTPDLRKFWAAPLATVDDVFHPPCFTTRLVGARLWPEQYVFTRFLAAAGVAAPVESVEDLRFEPFATSMRYLLAGFDAFDERAWGVWLPPRLYETVPHWMCIGEAGMRSLRAFWDADPDDAAASLHRTMEDNMVTVNRALDAVGFKSFP